jgi:hypothetical protein
MPVYMIRSGALGDVKIGFANDPLARLRQIQTGHPAKLRIIRVLEGDRGVERSLHERFQPQRLNGEWFSFSDDMLSPEIGCADLPIPQPKRFRGYHPDTARGRYQAFCSDVFEAAGGTEFVARALGTAPWRVSQYDPQPIHLAGAIVLARQAGSRLSLPAGIKLRDDAAFEDEANDREGNSFRIGQAEADRLSRWRKSNPNVEPWWPLDASAPPPSDDGGDA